MAWRIAATDFADTSRLEFSKSATVETPNAPAAANTGWDQSSRHDHPDAVATALNGAAFTVHIVDSPGRPYFIPRGLRFKIGPAVTADARLPRILTVRAPLADAAGKTKTAEVENGADDHTPRGAGACR